MNYLMVGLNHKTAPIGIREKLALDAIATGKVLEQLTQSAFIKEAAVISTCNRVEIYAVSHNTDEAQNYLTQFLQSSVSQAHDVQPYLQSFKDNDVIAHLFEVASSLDSMVLGENQISAQVKEAYQLALDKQASGAYLNKLFNRSLFVSKRVKTETEIGQGNVSVGSAGVMLAKKIFGSLKDKAILLLGAGEIGELVVRYLNNESVQKTFIVNRTLEKAKELETLGLGTAYSLTNLFPLLEQVDILITSVSGIYSDINKESMKQVMQKRRYQPLFIIDLGVPRNVVEDINTLDNIYLYNIDDLKMITEEGKTNRVLQMQQAKNIIDEEVRLFYDLHLEQSALPTIANLSQKFESVRKQELAKTLAKLPKLSATEAEQIEKLTQSLVSKILYDPILILKNRQEMSEPSALAIFKKIFRLDDEE